MESMFATRQQSCTSVKFCTHCFCILIVQELVIFDDIIGKDA